MSADEQTIDGGLPWICTDAGDCFIRLTWDRINPDGTVAEFDRPPKHAPRAHRKPMQVHETHDVAPSAPVVQEPIPQPAAPVAQIAVPSPATAAQEIAGLAPQTGASGVTVVLAAIAVLGGGAGWKFYSQWAKQRHEERMAEIERGPQMNDENRKRCDAHANASQMAIDAVSQRVSALETRVTACESNAAKMSDGLTVGIGEDVSDRLTRVEKALKALKKPATTARR